MPLGSKAIALRQKARDLLTLYDGPREKRLDWLAEQMGISSHAAAVLIGRAWYEQGGRSRLVPPISDGH